MQPEWKPFLRKVDQRFYSLSQVRIFIASYTTAPIRILMCIVLVLIGASAAFTLPTAGVAAVARWVSRSILGSLGIIVKRTGRKAPTSEAACVVANHISFLDILALLSLGCCFVANHGVLALPGIGKVSRAIGCIFVARDSVESRAAAKKAISDRLNIRDPKAPNYAQLVIFPEGTTTNGRGLLQFRRGAFEATTGSIQPARIDYSNLQLSMALLSIVDLICILAVMGPGNEITVNFLPSIVSTSADAFADACRNRIADAKNPYHPSPTEMYQVGSHRDEAELMKIVSTIAAGGRVANRSITLSK